MKQEEKRLKDKKARLKSQKVKSFVKPFEHRHTVMGTDAYNIINDDIGNDIFLSDSDPNGSYTGITRDGDNRPVQDADDL